MTRSVEEDPYMWVCSTWHVRASHLEFLINVISVVDLWGFDTAVRREKYRSCMKLLFRLICWIHLYCFGIVYWSQYPLEIICPLMWALSERKKKWKCVWCEIDFFYLWAVSRYCFPTYTWNRLWNRCLCFWCFSGCENIGAGAGRPCALRFHKKSTFLETVKFWKSLKWFTVVRFVEEHRKCRSRKDSIHNVSYFWKYNTVRTM